MLHKPFLSTVITQESCQQTGKLRGWFDDLFSRPLRASGNFRIQPRPDEMAQIYTGTFAVARAPQGALRARRRPRLDFDGRLDRDRHQGQRAMEGARDPRRHDFLGQSGDHAIERIR